MQVKKDSQKKLEMEKIEEVELEKKKERLR